MLRVITIIASLAWRIKPILSGNFSVVRKWVTSITGMFERKSLHPSEVAEVALQHWLSKTRIKIQFYPIPETIGNNLLNQFRRIVRYKILNLNFHIILINKKLIAMLPYCKFHNILLHKISSFNYNFLGNIEL